MKKAVVFLMISVMAVTSVGCGKKSETGASSADTADISASSAVRADLPDFSAYYGKWYNVDTSMAEVEISDEGISLRGDVYQVDEVVTEETTNSETNASYTAYTLYTEEADDGLCLKAVLMDETGTNADYKSMELYNVDRDDETAGNQIGSYVNDIQYTNGDLSALGETTEDTADTAETTEEGTVSGDMIEPSLTSDDASYYLLDSVEMSDGSTKSKDEYSDQEFALIYSNQSPVMNGMMFSTDTTNLFMISSSNGVIQLDTEIPSDDGSTKTESLPVTFDENAGTMTLDCSGTDLGVKKMIFKLVGADEFFSGNREILRQ